MRFTISAVNQLGVYKMGLIGKVDLVDLAVLDYIRVWSNSESAIKNEKDATWISLEHLVSEMPILGFASKQSASRRIKKLHNLNLIESHYDRNSHRLFVVLTHSYNLISEQKNEGGQSMKRYSQSMKRDRQSMKRDSLDKIDHPANNAIPSPTEAVNETLQPVNETLQPVNETLQPVNENGHRTDILLTDILKTETKKENNKEKKTASKTTSKNESKTAKTKTTKNKHDDEDRSQGIWYKNVNIEQALNEGISEACIKSYITFRTSAKAPITDHAFSLMLKSALKAPSVLNMTAEDAINYTVQAGWKKVDLNWIKNSQQRSQRNNAGNADLFRSGFDDKPQQQSHLTKAASQDDASKFLSNVG